jgi:hypothetical protein
MWLDSLEGQSIMSFTPGVHKSRASKFCSMAPNICGPTVWCLFYVTILAPGTGFLLLLLFYFIIIFFENLRLHALHSVHTGCGVYCTSYTMDTGSKRAGALTLTTHL